MKTQSQIGGSFLLRFSFLYVGNSKKVNRSKKIQWIARRLIALIAPMVVKYSWNAVHTQRSTMMAFPNGPS